MGLSYTRQTCTLTRALCQISTRDLYPPESLLLKSLGTNVGALSLFRSYCQAFGAPPKTIDTCTGRAQCCCDSVHTYILVEMEYIYLRRWYTAIRKRYTEIPNRIFRT